MADAADRAVDARHATNVKNSLRELQLRIREHEQELQQLQASVGASHPTMPPRAAQVDVMTKAFENLTPVEPFLPFPDSVLPALLALRKTHRIIQESRAYLKTQSVTLEQARRELERERADVSEQRLLTKCLEDRIKSLQEELESDVDTTPEQVAQEKMDELKRKKRKYDQDRSRLIKALNKFIDDHLAAMLAAEDLGGPVVGDLMDIDEDDLAAGFSAQGRPKKAKAQPDEDGRQRRIDDIWGAPDDGRRRGGKKGGKWDEAAGAAQEMRSLTESLLNALIEAAGDTSASYVKLPKETAAARFLVRSKVALFHPKDSTRIRLVDFGRELDD